MIRLRHLKMASRFLAYRFRELHPFEVEANITNACNLRCRYCRCTKIKDTQMTTEQWRSTIRRLGALGTLRFKLHGGEPTLRPDFRELSAEVKRAGIITASTTNGSVIPSRPELLDYLDELCVSLDSPDPETNDRLRGAGSFRRAIKTIELALQRGLWTSVNMVLTSENVSHLEAMLEFCEALGVPMNAQPVVFGRSRYGDEAPDLALSSDEIREAHTRMVSWKRQGRRLLFSASSYQGVVDWPEDYSILSTKSRGVSPCVAGKCFINIYANGDVVPCVIHKADFTPKNIVRDGLDEALRHVQYHNCNACWRVFNLERRAVFGLRPAALLEVMRRA